MIKRERVISALNHKEGDMIPIDFGSTRSSGINAYAYRNLLEKLGQDTSQIKVFDYKQMLAQPNRFILDKFESDCAGIYRLAPTAGVAIDSYKVTSLPDGKNYLLPSEYNPVLQSDGSNGIVDKNGKILMRRPKNGLYYDDVYHPLADVDKLPHSLIMSPVTQREKNYVFKQAKNLYDKTDYAIVFNSGVSIFERGIKDFGFEEFLMRIYTDKKLIRQYMEQLVQGYIEMIENLFALIAPYTHVFQCNDDLGMQTNSFISPEVYREMLKPYHKQIFEAVKKQAPHVKILLHCCGSIFDIIPELISAGVDALNPVQIDAAKMDSISLKKEYGNDMVFWGGGCSTQKTLTFGTEHDVAEETKRLTDIFSPGGGFIFNQVHNIQYNVTAEKIITLYNTIIQNRKYKADFA